MRRTRPTADSLRGARRNGSTSARQHVSTAERQHVSTAARQHGSTAARQHGSTAARQRVRTAAAGPRTSESRAGLDGAVPRGPAGAW
ncbi:hypothetical protein C5C94_15180 [Rathayibacter sp. AY1C3]|nr:hypothetical protein C5C52_16660 [Rathayibacter sp. AY1E5]PPH27451.1 hypothetical protein C5C94_15180 [Rathayibacter sp. AY1C3]PPI27381.1 hypothetical protein C5D66_15695 [Rathayibacter sp. AY1B4]